MKDEWTALLAELAKAEGYRGGVKAALERAQGCLGSIWDGDDPTFNIGVRMAINAIKKLLDEVDHV